MNKDFLLFDMDGVLLKHGGYHQALQDSIRKIGKALGAQQTELTSEQIAQFEALSITNEWDTLAICTALILIQVWRIDKDIQLTTNIAPRSLQVFSHKPDFQNFLDSFTKVGPLPGESAYRKIIDENNWLSSNQMRHLKDILFNCRDIYNSLTLPTHQEMVLGSPTFEANYNLKPQLNTESYLLKFDRPIMTPEQFAKFKTWLEEKNHVAGILTNRPNKTPAGYVSAPEAEMGAKLVGMEELPLLGSGILHWYAEVQCSLPHHIFLKPNPVHSLGLIQICLGQSPPEALRRAVALWQGKSNKKHWLPLDRANITIFEDSVKGLQSGIAAKSLLQELDIAIELKLIGISENRTKKKALLGVTDYILSSINHFEWSA